MDRERVKEETRQNIANKINIYLSISITKLQKPKENF